MSRYFGEIEGVPEGTTFHNRKEASEKGVHKPNQAGISGSQSEGADSIVLSGGYIDDKDFGDEIIYTGHGGNDPDTKKQISHQSFTKQNLALVISENEKLPVRVIRGSSHNSPYSPSTGYRYDGLYYVTEHWIEQGIDGYNICRFRLVKESKAPLFDYPNNSLREYEKTDRKQSLVSKQVRNTSIVKDIKKIYNHSCQVCGIQLPVLGGYYSEAAHIKALGEPHNGPDVLENLLCLCPNHHVLFDKGSFAINQDYQIIGLPNYKKLEVKHVINKDFVNYHYKHFYEKAGNN